jgi:hypothetical protein
MGPNPFEAAYEPSNSSYSNDFKLIYDFTESEINVLSAFDIFNINRKFEFVSGYTNITPADYRELSSRDSLTPLLYERNAHLALLDELPIDHEPITNFNEIHYVYPATSERVLDLEMIYNFFETTEYYPFIMRINYDTQHINFFRDSFIGVNKYIELWMRKFVGHHQKYALPTGCLVFKLNVFDDLNEIVTVVITYAGIIHILFTSNINTDYDITSKLLEVTDNLILTLNKSQYADRDNQLCIVSNREPATTGYTLTFDFVGKFDNHFVSNLVQFPGHIKITPDKKLTYIRVSDYVDNSRLFDAIQRIVSDNAARGIKLEKANLNANLHLFPLIPKKTLNEFFAKSTIHDDNQLNLNIDIRNQSIWVQNARNMKQIIHLINFFVKINREIPALNAQDAPNNSEYISFFDTHEQDGDSEPGSVGVLETKTSPDIFNSAKDANTPLKLLFKINELLFRRTMFKTSENNYGATYSRANQKAFHPIGVSEVQFESLAERLGAELETTEDPIRLAEITYDITSTLSSAIMQAHNGRNYYFMCPRNWNFRESMIVTGDAALAPDSGVYIPKEMVRDASGILIPQKNIINLKTLLSVSGEEVSVPCCLNVTKEDYVTASSGTHIKSNVGVVGIGKLAKLPTELSKFFPFGFIREGTTVDSTCAISFLPTVMKPINGISFGDVINQIVEVYNNPALFDTAFNGNFKILFPTIAAFDNYLRTSRNITEDILFDIGVNNIFSQSINIFVFEQVINNSPEIGDLEKSYDLKIPRGFDINAMYSEDFHSMFIIRVGYTYSIVVDPSAQSGSKYLHRDTVEATVSALIKYLKESVGPNVVSTAPVSLDYVALDMPLSAVEIISELGDYVIGQVINKFNKTSYVMVKGDVCFPVYPMRRVDGVQIVEYKRKSFKDTIAAVSRVSQFVLRTALIDVDDKSEIVLCGLQLANGMTLEFDPIPFNIDDPLYGGLDRKFYVDSQIVNDLLYDKSEAKLILVKLMHYEIEFYTRLKYEFSVYVREHGLASLDPPEIESIINEFMKDRVILSDDITGDDIINGEPVVLRMPCSASSDNVFCKDYKLIMHTKSPLYNIMQPEPIDYVSFILTKLATDFMFNGTAQTEILNGTIDNYDRYYSRVVKSSSTALVFDMENIADIKNEIKELYSSRDDEIIIKYKSLFDIGK